MTVYAELFHSETVIAKGSLLMVDLGPVISRLMVRLEQSDVCFH